ncbi:WD repeat-containing protein 61 [Entomortierella chlamydospora]|uniref:WD repeat-containing protein 61 n=1 Tax=Entomortierella chlamydospora TaxID=101097 RepID=A0A9P6SWZ4_9FUNG|nr:WD repeat-containing protein 61 [Entomortierella chlamydospora]KAG0008958.1 WD repeat-containing protein 61 [Entomortierella chlamydospora]
MPTQFVTNLTKEDAHEDGIWSVAWSSKNTLVTGSLDNTVKVWNTENGELKGTLTGHQLGVNSVDTNADGSLAVSTSLDSQIRIWDLDQLKQHKIIDAGAVQAWTAKFSPDSKHIATGSSSGNVNQYSVETGEKVQTFEGRGKFSMCVAYSPNGEYVACGTEASSDSATVLLFDVATGKLRNTFKGHAMTVRSLAFSDDSTKLVTGSDDKRIMIYDAVHGDTIRTLSGHSAWVLSVAVSSDGVHVASGSSDSKVKLWDLVADQCIDTMDGHNDQVWGLAWNKQGNKFASVSDDKAIKFYSTTSA